MTSGTAAGRDPNHAATLAANWTVSAAVENPGDDSAYPGQVPLARNRDESVWFDAPVRVDAILCPEKWDQNVPIGRLFHETWG